jgi:hypothetical protein
MGNRLYYSRRNERNPKISKLDLTALKDLFLATYSNLQELGYFSNAFGISCQDGDVPGYVGLDVGRFVFCETRKKDLWPLSERISAYSEEDLFDVIEFLYDHVSEPTQTLRHGYDNACVHFSDFDKSFGIARFRSEINPHLNDYATGFELSVDGEILAREKGYEILLDAKLPAVDPQNLELRVSEAVRRFQRHNSTQTDRREAVRLLADVLEFLRPQLHKVITKKDESDLFNIANNFGIRHHNARQKNDYDQEIWLRWMFYHFLTTIHATTRMLVRGSPK